jgi:hypothetical protein
MFCFRADWRGRRGLRPVTGGFNLDPIRLRLVAALSMHNLIIAGHNLFLISAAEYGVIPAAYQNPVLPSAD